MNLVIECDRCGQYYTSPYSSVTTNNDIKYVCRRCMRNESRK